MNQTLDNSIQQYNNGYYKTQLEIGMEYQDKVAKELYKRGIVLINYTSKKYQYNEGENMLGAEIKRDGKFRTTGNLYFETYEKSHPNKTNYMPSGISRNDNAWLYVIGDEETIYIFALKYLRKIINNYKSVSTPTSKGYLMPVSDAEEHCIRKIEMKGDK